MVLTSWSHHIRIMLTHYQMMTYSFIFYIVKLIILGLIIRTFMWNLRGTKCRAQSHNNREVVAVWVSSVVAKRASIIYKLNIKLHKYYYRSKYNTGHRRRSGWSGFNLTNFGIISIVSMVQPDQLCYS